MDYMQMAGEFLRIMAEQIKSAVGRETVKQTQGELLALYYLYEWDRGIFPQTLSREMHVSSARIAAMLRDMEEKGWIVRGTDPENSRRILVSLTQRGRDEAMARRERSVGVLAKIFERLGSEDTGELIRILKRMNEISM